MFSHLASRFIQEARGGERRFPQGEDEKSAGERPLKAIVRGSPHAIVPDLLDQPQDGRLEAQDQGDGQPLSLHRPLRLAREDAQPRR